MDAKLDLHGLTRDEAGLRLRTFPERCVFLGKRRVLVIHGKGSGVLRDEVRTLLEGSSLVASFSTAPGKLGGEGAVIVILGNR